MPTSSVGPLGPYDLILQDKASSPTTSVGLMLDLDEGGAPRVREFRVSPVPPRQSQGFLADSSLDPLVDYIYVQDDWSGGAIRPYYREGDRRYQEADEVDARWEGVLALGMDGGSRQLSIVVPSAGWEDDGSNTNWVDGYGPAVGQLKGWVLTGMVGDTLIQLDTTVKRTGNFSLQLTEPVGGDQGFATYPLPSDVVTALIGQTITFGVWARGNGTDGGGNITITVTGGTGSGTTALTSTTTWTFATISATIGAGATAIDLIISTAGGAGASEAFVDDMVLRMAAGDLGVNVVEAAGSYYAAFGPWILIWNEARDSWTSSYVQLAGTQATSIISYKNKVYVGYGLSTAYVYGTDGSWTVASGGSGEDTYAQFFTVQDNRLWKNETANVLRYSTTDPAAATTWGVKYTAGEVSAPITGLYMLNHAIVVGTETGLHTWFEDELRFRNVTNQFLSDPDTNNFRRGVARGSWLYLTTAKQGLIRFNGYAIEDLSELFISPRLTGIGGRVRAITQDQHQIYLLVDTPTVDTSLTKTTRLMSMRNIGGEWQVHILANVDIADANTLAVAGNHLYMLGRMSQSTAGTYYPAAFRYYLPQKSAAPYADDITVRFLAVTGTITLPIFHAAGRAALIKVELLCEDTDTNNTVAVDWKVDGRWTSYSTLGTVNTTTTGGAVTKVTLNNSSMTTPTNSEGRFWQFRLTFTRASTQAVGAHESPKVYAFVAHFVLAPTPVPAWEVYVRVGEGVLLKNGMQNPVGKTATLTDLNTLETQAYPITLVEDFSQDNTENSHYVRIRDWERVLEDPEVHRGRPTRVGELYKLTLQKII